MNGGDDNSGSGVFCDHGNHTQANTGSQTNIIMTIMVMMEKLSMKPMVVNCLSLHNVAYFTITICQLYLICVVLQTIIDEQLA